MSVKNSIFTRFVEVGRVVLINAGPYSGQIAVIAQIINHKKAIIDGPTTDVPRQPFQYKHLALTPLCLTNLPNGARSGVIRKHLKKEATVAKWEKSAWEQKRVAAKKRRRLSDFGRFKMMLAKKARRDGVRKRVREMKSAA